MADSEILILRPAANKGGLLLRCERIIDRFQKTVLWADENGIETVVLQSVEGTAAEDFPASPPIQQIHIQEINGAPVMLGVGMAGRGHWSASIMLDNANPDEGNVECSTLLFQYAAKFPGTSGWLGCTWSLANGITWSRKHDSPDRDSDESEWFVSFANGGRLVIRPHLPVGCNIKRKPEPGALHHLVLVPNGVTESSRPACWDYAITAYCEANQDGTGKKRLND